MSAAACQAQRAALTLGRRRCASRWWRSRAQKLRSFLTLLGVLAGVATVIMMVSFVVGFNNSVTGAFTTFGTSLVQFQKYEPRFGGPPELIPEEQKRRRNLTLDDAAALKRLATLAAAVSPGADLLSSSTAVGARTGRGGGQRPVRGGRDPRLRPRQQPQRPGRPLPLRRRRRPRRPDLR